MNPALAAALLVASVVLMPARAAHADRGWWLLPGLNLGASGLDSDDTGFLGGVEVSVASLGSETWFGGFAEAALDRGAGRVGIGLEAGVGPVGLDAAVLARLGEETDTSVRVRGVLTAAFIAIYVSRAIGGDGGGHALVSEVGVLLKVPLELTENSLGSVFR